MKILDKTSLIATVDAFNDAVFFDRPWQRESEALVSWIGSRIADGKGYAGSFALTESDWSRECRLFTGERLTTGAARSHILAEEATRVLAVIKRATGLDSGARKISEQRLSAQIFANPRSTAASNGIYCCGKCSLALWRGIVAGSFKKHASILPLGFAALAGARDGTGGWKRFPFYYTLLFLSEAAPKVARREIEYCSERILKARKLLSRQTDPVSRRRLMLIDLLLAHRRFQGATNPFLIETA